MDGRATKNSNAADPDSSCSATGSIPIIQKAAVAVAVAHATSVRLATVFATATSCRAPSWQQILATHSAVQVNLKSTFSVHATFFTTFV